MESKNVQPKLGHCPLCGGRYMTMNGNEYAQFYSLSTLGQQMRISVCKGCFVGLSDETAKRAFERTMDLEEYLGAFKNGKRHEFAKWSKEKIL
jgi:hypothetical protein